MRPGYGPHVVGILIALALASPPRATLTAGRATLPLAVSSWCWGRHCGAPIAASTRTAVVARGGLVRVDFAFAPSAVHVAVAGRPVRVVLHNREISWRARLAGGVTINATGSRGWVTYVARLRLR
jgi:hypothetical protein